MALSPFAKKDRLITPTDESTEQYEYLSPIQTKAKTRRIMVLNGGEVFVLFGGFVGGGDESVFFSKGCCLLYTSDAADE